VEGRIPPVRYSLSARLVKRRELVHGLEREVGLVARAWWNNYLRSLTRPSSARNLVLTWEGVAEAEQGWWNNSPRSLTRPSSARNLFVSGPVAPELPYPLEVRRNSS
jgi:hypothetical protein